jgi:UDP-glucose 4-epimerase
MKIAITGGRGGIGRAITEMALARGHSVISIDKAPVKEPDRENVKSVVADMTDYAALEAAMCDADALIHMAAFASPDMAEDYIIHNNNVVGSYNALSAARRLGMTHVCQASSINAIGAAYSRAPRFDYFPLDEAHPTYNEDPYSLSKWICEMQGDMFARRYEDMTISSMRFHWVVPDRAYAARHKQELLHEFSRNLWAYTRFDAAADACLRAMTADFKGHEAFFIVAPDTILDTPSVAVRDQHFPDTPFKKELEGNDSFFDSSKAERLLGWKHPRGDR